MQRPTNSRQSRKTLGTSGRVVRALHNYFGPNYPGILVITVGAALVLGFYHLGMYEVTW